MFDVPYAISSDLILFSFNQSLFPRICPYCSREIETKFHLEDVAFSRQLTEEDKENLISMERFKCRIPNPEGCEYCNKGFKGKVLVYEYFVPDEEIKRRIVEEGDKFSPLEIRNYVRRKDFVKKGLAKFKVDLVVKAIKEGLLEKETILKI
jgi:type II secretory ATPase GspE/PulE/Tfp pilus assembly ATPase PilB-like protein